MNKENELSFVEEIKIYYVRYEEEEYEVHIDDVGAILHIFKADQMVPTPDELDEFIYDQLEKL